MWSAACPILVLNCGLLYIDHRCSPPPPPPTNPRTSPYPPPPCQMLSTSFVSSMSTGAGHKQKCMCIRTQCKSKGMHVINKLYQSIKCFWVLLLFWSVWLSFFWGGVFCVWVFWPYDICPQLLPFKMKHSSTTFQDKALKYYLLRQSAPALPFKTKHSSVLRRRTVAYLLRWSTPVLPFKTKYLSTSFKTKRSSATF